MSSSGALDWESWRRAWAPALKTFGYFVLIYLLVYIIIILPAFLLVNGFGLSKSINELASFISIIVMVFAFFVSFYKVMDEQRPGEIPLDMV